MSRVRLEGGEVLFDLEPQGRVGRIRFRLPEGEEKRRLIVQLVASEEVEVVLYHGLSALRAERGVWGELRGKEYAYTRGRGSFELHTGNDVPGGYWVVALENLSGFRTNVSVRAWAEVVEKENVS